ncbi:hypothetical protein D9M68_511210 [compost metagenome]
MAKQIVDVLVQQVECGMRFPGQQGMTDGGNCPAFLQIGFAGSLVQCMELFGMSALYLVAEEIKEQAVIPVEIALFIDRNEKQLVPLQFLQHVETVGHATYRIAKRGTELVQYAATEQEMAEVIGEGRQDVLGQVGRYCCV